MFLDLIEQLYYETDFTREHRRSDRYSPLSDGPGGSPQHRPGPGLTERPGSTAPRPLAMAPRSSSRIFPPKMPRAIL